MEHIGDDNYRAQWSVFGFLDSLRQHVANIHETAAIALGPIDETRHVHRDR